MMFDGFAAPPGGWPLRREQVGQGDALDEVTDQVQYPGAACPLARTAPTAATLQDWLDEFERIQLMLLLTARLRQKHDD